MNDKTQNPPKRELNYNAISFAAGIMSTILQYNQLNKFNPPLSNPTKLFACGGTFLLCFYVTRLMLKNINEI
jgi:hypothetical protein